MWVTEHCNFTFGMQVVSSYAIAGQEGLAWGGTLVAFGGLNLGDSGVFGASQMPPYDCH